MPSAPLTAQDRWDIQQTLALIDHVTDAEQWELLGSLVTRDARVESRDGTFEGPGGIRAADAAAHPGDRPSHHLLNTAIRSGDTPDTAVAWSRTLVVTFDQRAAGGDVIDTLQRIDGRWLVRERRFLPRDRVRAADGSYTTAGAAGFSDWLGE